LSKKGTYRQKYIAKTGDVLSHASSGMRLTVSKEIQDEYEEGKMLLLDKPLHWTSFDVVNKVRAILRIKKVGHAGTLDPLATGLLIICTGKYTKKINEFMSKGKEYTGSITLGAVTASFDLETIPEDHKDYSSIQVSDIEEAIKKFQGDILQLPPKYSALKQKGIPLYELARKGMELELHVRKANISAFEIVSIEMPVIHFRIECSTGTYIRSIANDLGEALGCGGYLSSLSRTKIGDMQIENALTIDNWINQLKPSTEEY